MAHIGSNTLLYNTFIDWDKAIRAFRYDQLPGLEAQLKMAPKMRASEIRTLGIGNAPTPGSVLFLIFPSEDGNAYTALIKRPQYEGAHSGQISFPGGKAEQTDHDYSFTALREANEELGLVPREVEIVGQLTELFIPPSNFLVRTFVGLSGKKPVFIPNPTEVEQLLIVPLSAFFRSENIVYQDISLSNGYRLSTPCYRIGTMIVWGATAMIISEFTQMASNFFNFPLNGSTAHDSIHLG